MSDPGQGSSSPTNGSIVIRGGRVIDPAAGRDEIRADVLVRDGRIAEVGPALSCAADREIDATNHVVCPGLIDIHVHFREPGQERKETIRSGAASAVAGGFTTVCAMPNTDPPLDTRASCAFVVDVAREVGLARVLPIGCVTVGRAGEALAELGDLVAGGACAFSDDGDPVRTAALMRRAIAYGAMLDRVVIDHCEDLALTGNGDMHEGVVSAALGLSGKPGAGEDVIVARDILIAEELGARVHIAHISTARSVELVREARRRGVRVTAEVTPHHLVLTDVCCRGFDASKHKMNPPLRTEDDRLACIAGLQDGTIEAIASDHAPHCREEKEREWSLAPNGIIGLETTLPIIMTDLVETGLLTLADAIRLMTTGPVECLGLTAPSQRGSSTGTLAIGSAADVAILDLTTPYSLGAGDLASRAVNSPFLEREVRGRAVWVLVDGRVVFDRTLAAAPR